MASFDRSVWPLDPVVTYLNHGGYGVVPNPVTAAQARWRARIERNPTDFLARELAPALRQAAGRVASALGAKGEDFVFVENATSGINAVLRSVRLAQGDEIAIVSASDGALWLRLAAQAYNSEADYDRLSDAIAGSVLP